MPAATASCTVATHSSKVVLPHSMPSPPPPNVRVETLGSAPNECCCMGNLIRYSPGTIAGVHCLELLVPVRTLGCRRRRHRPAVPPPDRGFADPGLGRCARDSRGPAAGRDPDAEDADGARLGSRPPADRG